MGYKIKQKDFIKACETARTQSKIAELLKVTRSAITTYLQKNPKMREFFEQSKQIRIDKAESNLDDALEKKEEWATKLTLTTQGKDRGFTTRDEIEHKIEHSEKSAREIHNELKQSNNKGSDKK